MRLLLVIALVVGFILSVTFAIPVPAHHHRAGQVVKFKPKDMTPVHAMGNAEGLKNNHHGVVLGHGANGHARVAHISSNPPRPNVHVKSLVHSVDFYGKIHVGHSHVRPEHLKHSSKFPGQHLTHDEVARIKLAGKKHAVAHEAAMAGRRRLQRVHGRHR